MGLLVVRWSWEAAEVGPEAGPVAGAEAAAGTVGVPGPRSRPLRSSGSGCGAEAAAAEAGERREGGDRGRSLLAQLPKGCPAGAAGARHRAGPEPGWKGASGCGRDEAKQARRGCQMSKEGKRDKKTRGGVEKGGRKNGRWKVKNEAGGIERRAAEGKIGISLDGAHAVNSITTHMQVLLRNIYIHFLLTTKAALRKKFHSNLMRLLDLVETDLFDSF